MISLANDILGSLFEVSDSLIEEVSELELPLIARANRGTLVDVNERYVGGCETIVRNMW